MVYEQRTNQGSKWVEGSIHGMAFFWLYLTSRKLNKYSNVVVTMNNKNSGKTELKLSSISSDLTLQGAESAEECGDCTLSSLFEDWDHLDHHRSHFLRSETPFLEAAVPTPKPVVIYTRYTLLALLHRETAKDTYKYFNVYWMFKTYFAAPWFFLFFYFFSAFLKIINPFPKKE